MPAVAIDHEISIISRVIRPPLIQEGQLSVPGRSLSTSTS